MVRCLKDMGKLAKIELDDAANQRDGASATNNKPENINGTSESGALVAIDVEEEI